MKCKIYSDAFTWNEIRNDINFIVDMLLYIFKTWQLQPNGVERTASRRSQKVIVVEHDLCLRGPCRQMVGAKDKQHPMRWRRTVALTEKLKRPDKCPCIHSYKQIRLEKSVDERQVLVEKSMKGWFVTQ